MKKFFTMIIRQFKTSPFKMFLTLIAVSLGAFILVISFNVTDIIEEQVEEQLNSQGIIVQVANGTWDADGTLDSTRPSEWDTSLQDFLLSDTDSVEASAIISGSMFNQFTYDGTSYDVRNSVATEASYFDIYELEIIAGLPMTSDDVEMGSKEVWISEETAILVFGSAENAVDQWIQPPGEMMNRGMNNRSQNVVTQYKVAGVYTTPSEIKRKVYGIGDLIVPYTSMIPGGMNTEMAKNMMAGHLVVKSSNESFDESAQAISAVIYQNFGDDIDLVIWEGSSEG